MKPTFLILASALLSLPLGAQTTLFSADFDSDSNGNNQAITAASLSAAVGTWSGPEGGQSAVDDLGEIIGNAAGAASTNNAFMLDSGEDNDGSTGISPSNTDALLQGNFSSPATVGAGETFSFTYDFYHTRVAGGSGNNVRNFRLSLNAGLTRELVLVFELQNGTDSELVVRDGNDDYDSPASAFVVDNYTRPTTNRSDGDYNPAFHLSVTISIDAAGEVTVSATDATSTATLQTVTSTTLTNIWNGGSSAPSFIDNFELFVGGSNTGSKGAVIDNIVATGTPFPGPFGDLTTSIVGSLPSPNITQNPNPGSNLGSTTVAAGNSKGQSFSVAADTSLTGFVFEVNSVTTPGDFTLEIYRAMDGLPWLLDHIFLDRGSLPAGLAAGNLMQINLKDPLNVERGSYFVSLTGTGSTDFSLTLSNDALYPAGAAGRNNSSTTGWQTLTAPDADTIFAVLGTEGTPDTPGTGPNIIFILADDLGWTDIRTGGNGPNVLGGTDYGSGFYQTPNLVRLANEGLSFTHCYVHPNCAPTRAALFSGQYAPRSGNGVYHVDRLNREAGSEQPTTFIPPSQNEDVPASHTTMAEALTSSGYVTAHFGKFHVGNHEGGDSTMPENQGFDFNFGGQQNGAPGSYTANGGVFSSSVGPGLDAWAASYTQDYIDTNLKGPVSNPLNTRAFDFPALFPNAASNDPDTKLNDNKHLTDGMADAGMAFMRDHLQGSLSSHPFFMQFHFYAVHTPIQSRSDLNTKYGSVPDGPTHGSDNYAGLVEGMDQAIGRLLDFLDDPNGDGSTADSIAGNTVVIFCSDNGGHIGPTDNDPLRHRKGSFWDGGMRVPLIVRQPGTIPQGQATDSLVHAVDFYPTLVDLANGSMPGGLNFDGTSFALHLDDPAANPRDREAIFYHFPGYLDQRARPVNVVIKRVNGKEYKLIYNYDLNYTGNPSSGEDTSEGLKVIPEPWQLFNLTDDISETTDLLDGSYSNWLLYGDIATAMADELNTWLNQPGADWDAKKLVNRSTSLEVPYPTSASLPAVVTSFESSFRVTGSSADFSNDEVTLEWPGEVGFLYDIQVSADLQSWSTIVTNVPGTGNPTSHTFSDPLLDSETERFYRVVLHD